MTESWTPCAKELHVIRLVTLKTVRSETCFFIFTCRSSFVVTPCSDVQSEVDVMGVSSRKVRAVNR